MDKYYLVNLNPKYNSFIYFILFSLIIIIICLFYFKTYDVYKTKGYLNCDDKCYITISVDILDTHKLDNIDYLIVNKEKIDVNNIDISEIKIDESTQSNYQIVKYEVNNLNNINTFQDVIVFSNYETIITKIKNILF